MTDTETVPRNPDREPASKPLVDDQLADELLGRAQAEGVELLGPDGLLSRVTTGQGIDRAVTLLCRLWDELPRHRQHLGEPPRCLLAECVDLQAMRASFVRF